MRSTAHARNVARALFSPADPIPAKPQRAKPRDLEGPVHRSILGWLRAVLPVGAIAFHIPNGGARDARVGAKMKALGTMPGIPDLCVIHRGRALFLEVKAPGSEARPSRSQPETMFALTDAGCPVCVVSDIEGARAFLRKCGVTLRCLKIDARRNAPRGERKS